MKKIYILAIVFSLLASNKIFAQASYLGLDGGFEGSATIDNVTTGAAPVASKWTKSNANITITAETGTVRSGSNSIKVNASSASTGRMFSPQFSISASTTKWVIQCYRRATSTTATVQFQMGNFRGATETLSGTYAGVTATNTWEKVTYSPTSVVSVTTAAADIIAKMVTSAGDVYLDDFAMYESSTGADVTAANAPTAPVVSNPTGSSLDVSWTAASGGVDGGGYMVVRGTFDPTTTPNVNGIYKSGNTTAVNENVVYVGTALTFTDVGLAASATYYYRIYTFDKAYNYSAAATVNGVTSGVCLAPTTAATSIIFSSTTTTTSTVNWTNGNGSKRIVVARLGSAVTWTPTDNTTYTANASFGSGTDVSGSGEYVVYNNNSNTVPVTNLAATSTYYFKVYEYNCSAGSEKYYLTSPPSNSVTTPASIAAPTFSTPVCLSYGGATLLVSFTSVGTFTGNTYTVEMSNGAGSFAAPTIIGTTVSNSNAIANLSCAIPYGTAGGAGNSYLLRVKASSPATTSATSTALSINTQSISPLTTQNFSPGAGGGGILLTVSGTTGVPTKSWAYATVSGGPYTAFVSAGTTFTPSFAACGTYYVVCQVTSYSCGTTTSAEVQCNVTMPAVTLPTVTNACIADETVNWTLPAGYNATNNTILVFAKAGSAVTAGVSTNAIGSYSANTIFGSGTTYQNDASAFCIYNGTSNTVNISGLTSGATYHYLILNVQNTPTIYATGATANGATLAAVPNVSGLTVTPANGELIIGWTMASCFDDVLIVVTDNASVTATPTGDGTLYVDYSVYGDPTSNVNLPSNEFDVYQGTGTSVTVSGLVNLTTYNIKIFTRKGTTWSSGTIGSGIPNTTTGDFQTLTSGNWTDYTTWQRFNGATWVNATLGEFPNLSNYGATILNGHTVTLDGAGPYSVSTLTVQVGGKLYTNQSLTNIYVSIFSQIVCNGTIGNYPTDDGIGFNIEGVNCTFTGTGNFACSRIKKDYVTNATSLLTISINANLTWSGTALYNNQAGTTFNTTINSPYIVSTRATMGNISIDGTGGNGSGNMRGTITVKGTLNVNGKLYMTTDNGVGSTIGMTITATGTVNVDSVNAADGASAGHVLTINNGGRLNIYGLNAIYLFGNTKNTFTCNTGSTIEYSGIGAQPVESGINYLNLKYSGSGNKTANSNLTVNGNFTVDAAIAEFNTSIKTLNIGGNLTLQNGGTMSDNCKTFLNITTSSATTAQTFTGNSQIIKCLNLTSVKTAGSLSLTANTDFYITNDLMIDHSGTAVLTDNGNTLNVGDDAQLGGTSSSSSNFSLTGTLKFICVGATDIHLSDYAGTGVAKAGLGNVVIDPELSSIISAVQFYPTGGGQTIYINGNLTIANTNSLSTILDLNNNSVSLKGNWINYSSSGFTEGTGMVSFAGTVAQTITGAEIFNKIEINNANGVTINNYILVSTELKLTNGTLTTGANEVQVTSNAIGSVTGYSASSYIVGNLRRNVSSSGIYDLPVGNANYQLATIGLNSSTGMSSILALFTTVITGASPVYPTTQINGTGITGILNSGFWTITPDAYSAVSYDVTLNQRGYSNFSGNATQLGLIKRASSGAIWAGTNLSNSNGHHDNTTQSIVGGTAVAKRTAVTSFSDFVIGFGGVPLPVTLTSFNLIAFENKRVELNWKTESEIDCDYYSIERSADGINFSSIGKVVGHATSDQPHSYQLIDYSPLCSTSYYRINQLDFSSIEHFSQMLSAVVSCSGITMYPNLVLDKINIKFLEANSAPFKITITNMEGKKFIESSINFSGTDLVIDVSTVGAGLYFIHLSSNNFNFNEPFIKQ